MKNINIGIANLVISNKLKDSYFNNSLIEESKKLTMDFFDIIKTSPILQLEFKVFNNLENKSIDNDLAATRYIDSNIKLFEVYTISEIRKEHEKLNEFFNEDVDLDSDKFRLYDAIGTLITESINNNDVINVDNIYESFGIVLNHIKSPKKQLVESHEIKSVDNNVLEIAINKFNKKYDNINEDDKNILKKLIKSNDVEKEKLFEEYKDECIIILESVKNNEIENEIWKTIKKIREMKHNTQTINDDIIGLHELKKGLL